MGGDGVGWVFASVILSLRIAPSLALAPPFTLTRLPTLFRLLFSVGIAAGMAAALPSARLADLSAGSLAVASASELMLGVTFALALQLAFAAIGFAGRMLDIQAGFGLAGAIDPTNGAQTTLISDIFVYAGAAIFFATGGADEFLRIIGASLQAIPLGAASMPRSLDGLYGFITILFATAMGVAGGGVLCLLLIDLTIAYLSRTVPQMNVLILGLQVKSLLVLVILPSSIGFSAVLLARLIRYTLDAAPGLFR